MSDIVPTYSRASRPTALKGIWIKIAAASVLTAFTATMALGYFLPVYADEVTWKLLQSRYLIDGFVNITLLPQCGASFVTEVPYFMVPSRLLDAFLFQDLSSPMKLRIYGIAGFLAWCAVMLVALPKCLSIRIDRFLLASVFFGYLGLGVLPYIVSLSRPEIMLLWCFSLLLVIPLYFGRQESLLRQGALTAGFVLIASVAIAQHPKSLLFFPLILTSFLVAVQSTKLRLVGGSALLYFAASGYSYWMARNTCPSDVAFEQASRLQLVPLSDLFTNPAQTLATYAHNAIKTAAYFWNLRHQNIYGGERWLPPNDVPGWVLMAVNIAIFAFFAAFLVFMLVGVSSSVVTMLRGKQVSGCDVRRNAITLACLLSIGALGTVQGFKHFYESGLIIPLIGLIMIVNINSEGPISAKAWKIFGASLLAVSFVSQCVLWWSLAPTAVNATSPGYLAEQEKSVSFINYDKARPDIAEAASACGIRPELPMNHLVIDDMTYPVFQKSVQPFHIFFISQVGGASIWKSQSADKIVKLLKDYRSDGVIAGCHSLPADMRRRATQTGPFCCMSAFR
ncbi:hypothetical protein [Azospirillum canadense]|uniref:hypothetical protein n=1 Tax=Azospirillum canadense TaxID=403962 RepID=UPI002225F2E0|nr:hypothetical protein [Azospirillum canadense]MCW2240922.1 hypothetical protein [Azospirillum canadense]